MSAEYSGFIPYSKVPKWTIHEEIVLLYCASRQVKLDTIFDILAKKCGTEVRTVQQISHKAASFEQHVVRRALSCGILDLCLIESGIASLRINGFPARCRRLR